MIASSVANMISRFGSSATYSVRSGSINDSTLKKTATTTNYTVTMQVASFARGRIPGMVQDGDLEGRLAAAGLAFTPQKNDKVTWNGRVFTVVNVDVMMVGGEVAVYILVLRGAQ